MRRCHHVIHAKQDIVCCRFVFKYIECRARDMPRPQRRRQGHFIYQTTARAIHDPHALFGLVQRIGADDIAGAIGQRRMQGDEIGLCQQFVKFNLFNPQTRCVFGCQIGIIAHHPHFQPLRPICHNRTDIATADNAQPLAGNLGSHEAGFFPFASLCRFIRRRNLACQ